jgi:hypothetical protein
LLAEPRVARTSPSTSKHRLKPRREKAKREPAREYWSGRVTRESNALDLEPGVFRLATPHAIAESLRRSAERSDRRKAPAFRSAMSMLVFYINRAGGNLSEERRRVLERAKGELRKLYGKA